MELAREAVRLNNVTGYPHLVMAHVHFARRRSKARSGGGEHEQAMAEADAAVLARLSCPTAPFIEGKRPQLSRRLEEAVEFAQRAVRLTPVYPPFYPAVLASAYHSAQRHEEAVLAAEAALDVDTRWVDPYLVLAASNAALDRIKEARRQPARCSN